MPARTPPAYDDLSFTLLLSEVGCPMSLHEVKLFIAGCLAADEMPSLDTILSELWDGEEPVFDGAHQLQRFAGSFLALWNDLAARMDARPFLLSAAPPVTTAQDVYRYAQRRQAEVEAFLRGLDAGYTDVDRLPEPARIALDVLQDAYHQWALYEHVSRADANADAEVIADAASFLQELDKIASDAIWAVALGQRLERLRSGPKPGVYLKPVEPGRNDPCPCGSGKKYKRCCGK